jgi:signal transduction histidine kinase/DNA-binding response OmpR family regulator
MLMSFRPYSLIFLIAATLFAAGLIPVFQATANYTGDSAASRGSVAVSGFQDTLEIGELLDLARGMQYSDPPLAERYAEEAYQRAQNQRVRLLKARSAFRLGIHRKNMGKYLEANELLLEALSHYRRIRDKQGMAFAYSGLGTLSKDLYDFDKALEYLNKSAGLFRELKDDGRERETLLNIGTLYLETDHVEQAYALYSDLIRRLEESGDPESLAAAYINFGEVYDLQSMADSAEYYYRKSLLVSEKIGYLKGIMDSYHFIGKIFSQTGRDREAADILLKAFALADTLGFRRDLADISICLSDSYAGLRDFEHAYYFAKLSKSFEAELKREEAAKTIARNALAEQNRISKNRIRLFYYALLSLFVSVLLIITLYRNYRIKQKANLLLVEMDQLKSNMFSNITHEFRTPLTLILGPLEEMLAAGDKKNPTTGEVSMMRRNALRLLNLVNQMLDLASLDAHRMKLFLSRDDFIRFFQVRVLSFASLAHQKDINFSALVPDCEMITWFDADKLEKIINNLVSNAIKYTPKGGEVICGLKKVDPSGETVEFYVYDTGKGVSSQEISRIFDRFYKAGNLEAAGEASTGIGLSLTRELVLLMHGTIEVDSEEGRWTRFTVRLPLGRQHLKADEFESAATDSHQKISGQPRDTAEAELACEEYPVEQRKTGRNIPKVLVVEDQKEIREYLASNLEDCFRVVEAPDGLAGFEMALRYLPDLVITDLIMPGIDGLELCTRLKTDERCSHVPVVILTAKSTVEDRLKGLETGADAYITKPFVIREIKLVARKLIEQRKLLRERFSRDIRIEPRELAVTSADERFLDKLLATIDKNLGNPALDVNSLQQDMNMSRMQLFRKIKALTNLTPGEFIRNIRLKHAASLLEQGFGNIAEVCYEVGFSNPSHFAKCFRELYGVLPSEYTKKQNIEPPSPHFRI